MRQQIKIFIDNQVDNLEKQVNHFLYNINEADIVSISYQTDVTDDSSWDSVLIVYKVK